MDGTAGTLTDAEIAADEAQLGAVAKAEIPDVVAHAPELIAKAKFGMTKRGVLDFADRVGSTFFAGFIGVALLTGVSDTKALEAAALAGLVSVAKFLAVLANKNGA